MSCFSFNTIDRKVKALEMIEIVDSGINVGEIHIRLIKDHEWTDQIVKDMIDKYTNVYSIIVEDNNVSIDNEIHSSIKQWVR